MKKTKKLFICALSVLAIVGCKRETEEQEPELRDQVRVTLTAGASATRALNPFDKEYPVDVLVFQRASASVRYLDATPYLSAKGKVKGTTISITSGGSTKGELILPSNSTQVYDFIVLVNTPQQGLIKLGYMSTIPHGVDILAGRSTEAGICINQGDVGKIVVAIEGDTPGDGNLPHLTSALSAEMNMDQQMITNLGAGVRLAIRSITINKLGAGHASFGFNSSPSSFGFNSSPLALDLTWPNYNHTHTFSAVTPSDVTINKPSDKATYADGVTLPMPSKVNNGQNVVNIEFALNIGGNGAILDARNVVVPEFISGYRYTFSMVMNGKSTSDATIDLFMVVTPWNILAWEGSMGAEDGPNKVIIKIGSWGNVTWDHGMGAEGDDDAIRFSVSGWSNIEWTADMGANL